MRLNEHTAHIYADRLYKEHLQLKKVKQQLSQLQQENELLNVKLNKFEYYEEANDVLLKENKKSQQENQQLKQEKEDLIKWLEEKTLRLSESIKYIESRSILNRTPQLYIEKGAISMLKEILSKLKESDK